MMLGLNEQMKIDQDHLMNLTMNIGSKQIVFVVEPEPVVETVVVAEPEPVVDTETSDEIVRAMIQEVITIAEMIVSPEPVVPIVETVAIETVVVAEPVVEVVPIETAVATEFLHEAYDKLDEDTQDKLGQYMEDFFGEIENYRDGKDSKLVELYDAMTQAQKDEVDKLFPILSTKIELFRGDEDIEAPEYNDIEEKIKPVEKPIVSTTNRLIFKLTETFNIKGFVKSILDCAGDVSDNLFKKLTNTYDDLDDNNSQEVHYFYDNPHNFGRLRSAVAKNNKKGELYYSHNHLTGESFKRYMRADCFSSNSYDVDMVNAGPTIMSQIFDKHDIQNDTLSHYVKNRDEILKMLMGDFDMSRDKAKECMLTILYGGSVESVIKDNSLKNSIGLAWFRDYARDMSKSLNSLFITITTNSSYNTMCEYAKKKANIPREDGTKRCYQNTLISILYQTIESKVAIEFVQKFKEMGCTITTFIADGFHISRDKWFTPELINIISDGVFDKTGYKVNMIIKEFEHRPEGIPEFKQCMFERILSYDWMTALWQRYSFYVLANRTYYIDMGFDIHNLTRAQLLDGYGWIRCKMKKDDDKNTSFIKVWIVDPKHKKYTQAGMYAPPLHPPADTYNFWRGFPITLKKDVPVKSCDKMLAFIKELLKGDDEHFEYMLDWIADIIQRPCSKSDIGIMLFSVEQGSGKNTLVDILKSIIGQVYSLETCNPEDQLFGRFSKMKEHKFLTVINELSAELGHKNRDKIKNMITETDFVVDEKCKNTYMGKNWSRYLITTNNINALHIEQSDRRFVMFECSKAHVGDTDYFDAIRSEINDVGCCLALFNLLKNRNITRNLRTQRPKTDVYKMIQSNSKSPIIQWLMEYCSRKIVDNAEDGIDSGEEFQSLLFSDCKMWMATSYPDYKISAKKFGDTFGQLYNPNMNAKQDGLDIHSRPQNRPKLTMNYQRLLTSLENSKSV
jgi:hypothetical protein